MQPGAKSGQARSIVAIAAAILGGVAVAVIAVGIVGIHVGVLSPIRGFRVGGMLGPLLGLLASIVGLVALYLTRAASGRAGRSEALLGTALGAIALVAPVGGALVSQQGGAMIHDVTTDFEDPPSFSDAVRDAADRDNGVDYPDGGEWVPVAQRDSYPDLAPIHLDLPSAAALARSEKAARQLGWSVTEVDASAGRVEAYDVTPVFRFVDDVVIRIRAAPGGSIVDLRSNSRVGGGDLGANAGRIRAFRDLLLASG